LTRRLQEKRLQDHHQRGAAVRGCILLSQTAGTAAGTATASSTPYTSAPPVRYLGDLLRVVFVHVADDDFILFF
jgi:hypothetical protein